MNQNYSIFQEAATPGVEHKTANAIIVVKAEESLIAVSWQASPTPIELAQSAELLGDLIKQHGIHHLLHDIRNINLDNFDLQKCLATSFCATIIDAGIAKVVHLAKYEAPELILIDRLTDYVKQKFLNGRRTKFEICTTEEGALDWLYNVDLRSVVKTQLESQPVILEQPAYALAANQLQKANLIAAVISSYKEGISIAQKYIFRRESNLSANM